VLSTKHIPKGEVLGEYLGRLYDDTNDKTSSSLPRDRGYRVEMRPFVDSRRRVYVDAQQFGTVLRFVNHSCNPNTNFYEAAFGYRHTIVVVAIRDIAPDEEITISYGDPKKLWFACHCGEENCVDREHTASD
jgi:histone-lysine N-methyltransferase SETD2